MRSHTLRRIPVIAAVVVAVTAVVSTTAAAEQLGGQGDPVGITTECTAGTATLSINFGVATRGTTVVVTVENLTPLTVEVPAEGHGTVVWGGIPSGVWDISYTIDGGQLHTFSNVDLVCPQPPVVKLSCRDGQIYFSFTLDGTNPDWRYYWDFYLPDAEVDEYGDAMASPGTVEIGPFEDGSTHYFFSGYWVGNNQPAFGEWKYTFDCAAIIAESQAGFPGVGSSSDALALTAGAVLIAGVGLLGLGRRRRTAHA